MQLGGYFAQTKFISNSNLKELGKLLFGGFEVAGLQKIFDFGSLIDAHLTEPSEVKTYEALVDEDDIKKALLMKQAGEADYDLKLMIDHCQKQHEIYRNNFKFSYQGWNLELPIRVKMDFRKKNIVIGDLKSTASKNEKEFKEAIEYFDYDQQAALYLDADNTCANFLFIGIGKKANKKGVHPVMKFAVKRGDPIYNSGKAKYSFLMYKYYWLIHHLKI